MSNARELAELASSDVLTVDSGNVGIGSNAPQKTLHIESSSPALRISNTVDGGWSTGDVIGEIGFWATDGSGRETGYIKSIQETNGGSVTDGALVFGTTTYGNTTSAERMRVDSSGNLLVGNTSASGRLTVYGQALQNASTFRVGTNGYPAINFLNSSGSQQGYIVVNASSVSFTSISDYRLKENVIDITDGIERVKQLSPSRFNFIADADTTVDGFLAHEAQAVVPEAVTGTKDAMRDEEYEVTPAVLDEDGNVVTEAVMGTRSVPDYQGIDQSKLVPLLTAALQEAIAKIETLETKVAALESV